MISLLLAIPLAQEPENTPVPPTIPDGFNVELWASDPLLANPVVFWPDNFGNVYVCETYRQETEGVPDNRSHTYWTEDDLRCMTVDDRGKMYLKHHPEYSKEWTDQEDRIVLLEDTNNDATADSTKVFADGFNDLLDGTGAGLLVQANKEGGTDAWYTCIPNLWKLEDLDNDGVADRRESLHRGYGVRVALRGHDMHGLQIGPDGKLYFSIGDRGYAVENDKGELLTDPGSGAVFRCDLDGANLEIYCVGLRNPQELCFDDYGNLWTGDNNSDAGDKARIVYLMEGSDCGWRMNYQYLADRGPWMPESWWKPAHQGQPAFLNPPIANLTSGPSGIVHYPGTGLTKDFAGSFFIADFLGGPNHSGIRRFTMEANGAGFNMNFDEEFIWKTLATDVDFMPDGSLLVSDWVEGWTGAGKGRLWKVSSNNQQARHAGELTGQLLSNFHLINQPEKLAVLLSHDDRRVRMLAQIKLVAQNAVEVFMKQLNSPHQLARVHAIWGLTQLNSAESLIPYLNTESDTEVRAQIAKSLGENNITKARGLLTNLLEDNSARVKYFSLMSLGKLGKSGLTTEALLNFSPNDDRFLRHAQSWALSKTASPQELCAIGLNKNSRLAAVLALRLQGSNAIAHYLNDQSEFIATEAAIAIYDLPIEGAMNKLASTLNKQANNDIFRRRALHACFLSGRNQDAESLLQFANSTSGDLRDEAIDVLNKWEDKSGFDRLHNTWRPELPRENTNYLATKAIPSTQKEMDKPIARGRKVFFENPAASCQRCHWIDGHSTGEAPSEVGPELASIGLMLNKEQLRTAITNPAQEIAPGFEIKNGQGEVLAVSAMTANLEALLSEQELDDLVAYLESLKKPKKILVHVYSAGYEHQVAAQGIVQKSWQTWASEDPRIEVICDNTTDRFTEKGLADFDAIFFYTTGELPWTEENKQAFSSFLSDGGAFIGSHCATDTFFEWQEFGEMIGGYFDGHPWHQEVGVTVELENHLATEHLGAEFKITDEIYQFKNWKRSNLQVLLSLDGKSVNLQQNGVKRKDQDFAISWTKSYGKGRIFYTSLGHRPQVWHSKLFQKHLIGGTIWATRR